MNTRYYPGGNPPYGWELHHFPTKAPCLEPHPTEQSVIALIRAWTGTGDSLHAVCRSLSRLGVPTRTGGAWYPMSIRRILRGPRP